MKQVSHRLAVLFAASVAIGLIAVSSASAAAHFSDTTHGINIKGTLSVTRNAVTKKCSTPTTTQSYTLEATGAHVWNENPFFEPYREELWFNCEGGGTFGMSARLWVKQVKLVRVGIEEYEHGLDPWGEWFQKPTDVLWLNGSGSTPSTLRFNNSQYGWDFGEGTWPITLSGNLNVTTASGGLLTLTE
jgi:hypothetical protein